jgi:hypothetical protein
MLRFVVVCLFVVIINNNNNDYDNDEINMENSVMETARWLRQ